LFHQKGKTEEKPGEEELPTQRFINGLQQQQESSNCSQHDKVSSVPGEAVDPRSHRQQAVGRRRNHAGAGS
jgi:hypothetical protein